MRLTHILRRLLQLPLFTTVAVLTLAIGIGANAAIFSVVDGVLLKPLPYPKADELIVLDHAAPGISLKSAGAAPFLYYTYREDGRVFQDVALWTGDTESVTGVGEPEEVRSIIVTDGLLPMLGATPALGRLISKQDDTPGSDDTMMLVGRLLAHAVRQRPVGHRPPRHGQRQAARDRRRPAGRVPVLRSEAVADSADAARSREKVHLGQFGSNAVARLKPGVTLEQATADVDAVDSDRPREIPAVPRLQPEDVRGRQAQAEPAAAERRRDRRRRIGAVAADGDDRHGAADRLRERREPAAGPRRRTPAGAGGAGGARRQPRTDRLRAARRERRPRAGRRRRRARPRLRRGPRADRDGAGQPAAARQHLDRPDRPAVHVRRLDRRRPAVRRDSGVQIRRTERRRGAARRRPQLEREPRASSRAQHAGRRAGGAGAGAAGQLGTDDPHVPGLASREPRLHQRRAGADAAPEHSRARR